MKSLIKRVSILLLVLPLSAAAQDDEGREQIAKALPGWLQETGTPSAAIGVVLDGEVAWTLVAGERAPGEPATRNTLYNVASMTKPVTAEIALRLASLGRIELDEPLVAHWLDPDLANDPLRGQVTASLCLSHQCGFPNWRYETDDTLAIQWVPGSRPGYSGEGYDYVAHFLEEKLATPFTTLAKENVFAPLGMNATAFTRQPWFANRVALPKGPDSEFAEQAMRDEWSAADDLYTTINDYAQFVAAVMKGEGLSEDIRARRWKIDHDIAAMVCAPGRLEGGNCPQSMGFALGWARLETGGDTILFHGGADQGERAMAFFVPERRFAVIVLTNGANGMSVVRKVAGELYDNAPLLAFLDMQAGHE